MKISKSISFLHKEVFVKSYQNKNLHLHSSTPNRFKNIQRSIRQLIDFANILFTTLLSFSLIPSSVGGLKSVMWATSLCVLLLGFASCCVSLPHIQYVNDKPYHLMQSTECRGGKIFEINQVQDIDECKTACLHRDCKAVNLFQTGELEFKCEILAYVRGYVPAQGAACYVSYF